MILIIYAHPYPSHSYASLTLLNAARDLPDVSVRSLYELYPDFDIDVQAEQDALKQADVVVWLHPVYWYSVPGMLKHWFDVVLLRGWAYGGDEAIALRGKRCLWASTTGGDQAAYSDTGIHQMPFEVFEAPVRRTAEFCGMVWERPFVLHSAHIVSSEILQQSAQSFCQRLAELGTRQRAKTEGK